MTAPSPYLAARLAIEDITAHLDRRSAAAIISATPAWFGDLRRSVEYEITMAPHLMIEGGDDPDAFWTFEHALQSRHRDLGSRALDYARVCDTTTARTRLADAVAAAEMVLLLGPGVLGDDVRATLLAPLRAGLPGDPRLV